MADAARALVDNAYAVARCAARVRAARGENCALARVLFVQMQKISQRIRAQHIRVYHDERCVRIALACDHRLSCLERASCAERCLLLGAPDFKPKLNLAPFYVVVKGCGHNALVHADEHLGHARVLEGTQLVLEQRDVAKFDERQRK